MLKYREVKQEIIELKHLLKDANRILGERLFSHQYAQEMISDESDLEYG